MSIKKEYRRGEKGRQSLIRLATPVHIMTHRNIKNDDRLNKVNTRSFP